MAEVMFWSFAVSLFLWDNSNTQFIIFLLYLFAWCSVLFLFNYYNLPVTCDVCWYWSDLPSMLLFNWAVLALTASSLFSLLQAGLDPSGEGSRVLRLQSALFSTSVRTTRKSSMLYFTTSIHFFLRLSLFRCPQTFASQASLDTVIFFLLDMPKPSQPDLSHTLFVMHTTPRTVNSGSANGDKRQPNP